MLQGGRHRSNMSVSTSPHSIHISRGVRLESRNTENLLSSGALFRLNLKQDVDQIMQQSAVGLWDWFVHSTDDIDNEDTETGPIKWRNKAAELIENTACSPNITLCAIPEESMITDACWEWSKKGMENSRLER